jgi:D-alanyl-D-alanine carboxypeptidase
MENPTFCEIVSTKTYASRGWKNKNKLLYNCEGAIGVKTGYTKEAGRCLVSAVKRGDMTLICVVLGCPNMYERSASLYDDAFARTGGKLPTVRQ